MLSSASACFLGNGDTDRARMQKRRMKVAALSFLYFFAQVIAIEKPQYQIVHAESDFQVRLYAQATWMAAPVSEISFEKATLDGFHR